MDKRLFIVLGLFFVPFFAYQKFVLDPMAKKNLPPASSQPNKAAESPAVSAPSAPQIPPSKDAAPTPSQTSQPASGSEIAKAVVDTSLYRAEFSNRGAVLTS